MPIASVHPIMPEGLEDFPWQDMLHMWDYGSGWVQDALRLKLWYPWFPEANETARQYQIQALATHHEAWSWLEERFILCHVPEFEMEGQAYRSRETGEQAYARLAIWGTFHLGEKRAAPLR